MEHRVCSLTTLDLSQEDDTENASHNKSILIAENSSKDHCDIVIEDDDFLSFLKQKFEDFDLKTLLQTSPLGKGILQFYNTYNKLDNTRRNRLVSIIIKHLYTYIVKK